MMVLYCGIRWFRCGCVNLRRLGCWRSVCWYRILICVCVEFVLGSGWLLFVDLS